MSGEVVTAVLVPVPEVEPAVAGHRLAFDPAASWGVPAHVTVLYPFLPSAELTAQVVARLARAVRSVPAFDCRFRGSAWFGTDVLWLAPEPAEPFRELTAAVSAAFPQCPPYGGDYAEVVPHVTIGHAPRASEQRLRAVEEELRGALPIAAAVDRAWLMAGAPSPASWRVLHELPLGDPGPAPPAPPGHAGERR